MKDETKTATSYQDCKRFTTYLAVWVEDVEFWEKVKKHPDVIRVNVLKLFNQKYCMIGHIFQHFKAYKQTHTPLGLLTSNYMGAQLQGYN